MVVALILLYIFIIFVKFQNEQTPYLFESDNFVTQNVLKKKKKLKSQKDL